MNSVRLPNKIYGKWIWKSSMMQNPDGYALLRREFSWSQAGEELTMWISAVNTYQLFINGRLIGFGPRAHQLPDFAFIDQYDLSDYVENGINVITVSVSCNVPLECMNRHPGLWCQLATPSKEILCSDSRWLFRDGTEFCCNRPRYSRNSCLTPVIQADKLPLNWQLPVFEPDMAWSAPDVVCPVEDSGIHLELHPLPPPTVNPESLEMVLHEGGRVAALPQFSEIVFHNATGDGKTFAGIGFIFCEQPLTCKVKLFSDDPYRFFCGKTLICADEWSDGSQQLTLELRAGWNRLIFYQTPRCNAMGATFVFDGGKNVTVKVLTDMTFDALEGWNTAGPLSMSLNECMATLNISGMTMKSCIKNSLSMVDPGDLLHEAVIEPVAKVNNTQIHTHEYRIYRLDNLRYGFAKIEFTASRGDIVDIIIGVRRSTNGFVQAAPGVRGCSSFRCREGVNVFNSPMPSDCLYLGLAVRSARHGITINAIAFNELSVQWHKELDDFKCSDEQFNALWHTGKQTLRRNSAFIPIAESGSGNDCSLLDAYIDSVNMAAVYGDSDYIAFRLRRFIAKQYESGEIPMLTFGHRRRRQVSQMFFLPIWINYNYRFTANRVEFDRAIACLDRAREFFETMVDPATELISNIGKKFNIDDPLLINIKDDEVSTVFNSMYCRFMLSAAESYEMTGNETLGRHCRRLAARTAAALRQSNCDPATGLFMDRNANAPGAQLTAVANFYAMFAGVLPLEEFENFFFRFFTLEPPYSQCGEMSPYFQFHFLEMLFSLGQREWALEYFREYWQKRIYPDCCAWVDPAGNSPAPTRFCGGGSVSPNIFLLREVLGIRIADVGHSAIYFNPAFREVRFAEGEVPMAKGKLMVRWELLDDDSLDVTLNSTVPVKVVPELSSKRLATTTFRLSDQVTLLDPAREFDDEEE